MFKKTPTNRPIWFVLEKNQPKKGPFRRSELAAYYNEQHMQTGLRIRKGFTGEWQAWTHPQFGPPKIFEKKDPKKEAGKRELTNLLGRFLFFGAPCIFLIAIRTQLGAPLVIGVFIGVISTLAGCFCIWRSEDRPIDLMGFAFGISAVFVLVFSINNAINYANWLSSRCKYPGCWEKGTERVAYHVYSSPFGQSVTVYYCTNHVKSAPSTIDVSVPRR